MGFSSAMYIGEEIVSLVPGFALVEEHSFHEEMKKYSLRGKLFAWLFPKINNRFATIKW